MISVGRKWIAGRRTKSLFSVGTALVLFGFCTFFRIFAEGKWLFASRAIRAWEDWALASFRFGVGSELIAAFSWTSDNLVRKQKSWWTQ